MLNNCLVPIFKILPGSQIKRGIVWDSIKKVDQTADIMGGNSDAASGCSRQELCDQ